MIARQIIGEVCWKDAAGADKAYRSFVKRGFPIVYFDNGDE